MRALHENNDIADMEFPLPVMNIHGAEKSLQKLDDDGMSVIRFTDYGHCPKSMRSRARSTKRPTCGSFGPIRIHTPNGISVGLSVFAGSRL